MVTDELRCQYADILTKQSLSGSSAGDFYLLMTSYKEIPTSQRLSGFIKNGGDCITIQRA